MATGKTATLTAQNDTNDQPITGVGFPPAVVLIASTNATSTGSDNVGRIMFGAATGPSERVSASAYSRNGVGTSETSRAFDSAMLLQMTAGAGSDTETQLADLKSIDSDGFTLDWVTANASLHSYLALGGIKAKVGYFDMNGTTGNQPVAGVGFQPKAVIFFTSARDTTEGGAAESHFSFGAAVSASNRAAATIRDFDAQATTTAGCGMFTGKAFVQGNANTVRADADLVSMDSDGFTINVTTTPGSAIRVGYIALGGDALSAKVGTVTQKNGTGADAITGVGFQPTALIFFGTSAVTLDAMNANPRMTIGFATATNQRNYNNYTTDDGLGAPVSVCQRRLITTKCVGTLSNVLANVLCEADLQSFDSDGFTLDWTTADSTLRKFFYLALRIEPTATIAAADTVGPKLDESAAELRAIVGASEILLPKLDESAAGLAAVSALADTLAPKLDESAAGLAAIIAASEILLPMLDESTADLAAVLAIADALAPMLDESAAELAAIIAASEILLPMLDESTADLAAVLAIADELLPLLDESAALIVALARTDDLALALADLAARVALGVTIAKAVSDTLQILSTTKKRIKIPGSKKSVPAIPVDEVSLTVSLARSDALAPKLADVAALLVSTGASDALAPLLDDAAGLARIIVVADQLAPMIGEALQILVLLARSDEVALGIEDVRDILVTLARADAVTIAGIGGGDLELFDSAQPAAAYGAADEVLLQLDDAELLRVIWASLVLGGVKMAPAIAGEIAAAPALGGDPAAGPAIAGAVRARPAIEGTPAAAPAIEGKIETSEE